MAWPLIIGGFHCHTWVTDPAFAGVNAVAWLTELCCGSCRNCGQSRSAVTRAASVAAAAEPLLAAVDPDAVVAAPAAGASKPAAAAAAMAARRKIRMLSCFPR